MRQGVYTALVGVSEEQNLIGSELALVKLLKWGVTTVQNCARQMVDIVMISPGSANMYNAAIRFLF